MRNEIFRMLSGLCNSAMHRLIKGAETSSSSEPSKSIPTGDLGNTVQKANYALGLSLDSNGFRDLLDEDDEDDFTSLELLVSPVVPINPSFFPEIITTMSESKYQIYAHIDVSFIQSTDELEKQLKFLEFRKLLMLNINDIIIEEELSIHIYDKSRNNFLSGNIYLSRNAIHFLSTQSSNSASTQSKLSNQITPISSLLFESPSDCIYSLTIPAFHIVSLKKSATQPTGIKGVASAFLFSGFLIVYTLSKSEIWFAFQSLKTRDKFYESLLSRIKTVGTQEEEFEIGSRNGSINYSPNRSTIYLSPQKSHISLDTLRKEKSDFENVMINIGNDEDGSVSIFGTPLKFVFKSFYTPEQIFNDPALPLWFDYFNGYGKDTCMIKNTKTIRDLIVKTCGVPTSLRGDFWLLVSGAWHSKPDKDYYISLLRSNFGKSNQFTEEIEKDVRRFAIYIIG